MSISKKISESMKNQSWIREMFELGNSLKQEYGEKNVYDLSLGNPGSEPSKEFIKSIQSLLSNPTPGMHRYMPNAGYPATRDAVANHLSTKFNVGFSFENIIMTCGAGGSLNVILKSILDYKDEIIIFSPFFPEYLHYVENHGGNPIIIPTNENFLPDVETLQKSITNKTKGIIINSPNNPTGVVYPQSTIDEIGIALTQAEEKYGNTIHLISDEPYARLVYKPYKNPSIFSAYNNSILATSFSKDLSLAGERIGYAAINPDHVSKNELINAFTFSNRILGFVNAPALMQNIIPKIIDSIVDVSWYENKRNYLMKNLIELGYEFPDPGGAFFIFAKSPIPNDIEFVKSLLEYKVLVTPGTGFGKQGYFRISYSVEDWVLEGAIQGFSKVINN